MGRGGQHQLRPDLRADLADARGGPSRIEGNTDSTGLEDRQQRLHQGEGAVDGQRHHRAGSDALGHQVEGAAFGAGMELAVAHLLPLQPQRRGLGALERLPGEALDKAPAGRGQRWTVLPGFDPAPLRFRQQRSGGAGAVRVAQHRGQQGLAVGHQPFDRLLLEAIGGVNHPSIEPPIGCVADVNLQIQAGPADRERQRLRHGPIQQRRSGGGGLDQLHQHRNQRIAGGVPVRLHGLHDLLEGQLLMGIGLQRGLPGMAQEMAEGTRSIHLQADRQGVDETTDQILQTQALPAPHRYRQRQVVLTAVAEEKQGHQGKQPHLQRRLLRAAHRRQGGGERRGDRPGHLSPTGIGERRARPLCRQVEGFQLSELRHPEGAEPLEALPLQPLPLPDGVIVVTDP